MGVDMFTEERISFKSQINDLGVLNSQINSKFYQNSLELEEIKSKYSQIIQKFAMNKQELD